MTSVDLQITGRTLSVHYTHPLRGINAPERKMMARSCCFLSLLMTCFVELSTHPNRERLQIAQRENPQTL